MRMLKNLKFTLIELLVVVAVISILMAMLLPALSSVKASGRRAICLANQRQIGFACSIYSQDNNEWIVPYQAVSGDWTTYWNYLIDKDLPQINIFRCPSATTPWPPPYWHWQGHNYMSYGYNRYGLPAVWSRLSCIVSPSMKIWFADKSDAASGIGYTPMVLKFGTDMSGIYYVSTRHAGGGVLCFFDGHAAWSSFDDIKNEWW